MAFRLRTAVTDGLRLTFSRNGAVFVGCNAVAQFVTLMLLAVAASQQPRFHPASGLPLSLTFQLLNRFPPQQPA